MLQKGRIHKMSGNRYGGMKAFEFSQYAEASHIGPLADSQLTHLVSEISSSDVTMVFGIPPRDAVILRDKLRHQENLSNYNLDFIRAMGYNGNLQTLRAVRQEAKE